MSTWTAELINLLFHLTPKRHRYDIRSSYQWHRVPWYAGRNSANPRWRARKPRLVHAGFVAEPKDNQPPFLLWRKCFSKEKHCLWLLNNLPKEFGRLFSSYYTTGVSTLTCRPMVPLDSFKSIQINMIISRIGNIAQLLKFTLKWKKKSQPK